MFVLKILHYLNYKDHFYNEFVCPAENKSVFCRLRTILEVSGGFAELERVNSHVAVYRYETTSDQWSYLYQNIVFLVIILILNMCCLDIVSIHIRMVFVRL